MTGRDAFGLFVRIVGFLVALYGTYNLVFAIMQSTGVFGPATYPLYQHVAGGLVFAGLGALLVRLADRIADLAYPLERPRGE